jgi:hypothetical protein
MKNITVSQDKVEQWLEDLEYSDSDKNVIAAIKQALAAPVQPGRNHYEDGDVFERIAAMKKSAAQPAVQEPFGYLEIEDIESHSEYPHNCRSINLWHEGGEGMVAIYTTPPAQPAPKVVDCHATGVCAQSGLRAEQPAPVQEPIGYLFQHEETGLTMVVDVQQVEWGFEKNNPRHQKIGPVYTTPPAAQRQWVGLTDEDVDEAARYCVKSGQSVNAAIRAIEAKLKEKNNG